MRLFSLAAAPCLAWLASAGVPLAAQIAPIVDLPATRASAADGVSIFILNDSDAARALIAPATIDTVARDGSPLRLALDPANPVAETIAAHGFVKLRYRLVDSASASPAPPHPADIASGDSKAAGDPSGEQTLTSARGRSSSLAGSLYAYEPNYAVWGSGASGAKLQLSVGVRPFGGKDVLSHLRFAYTQQIFWRVNDRSGPIRSTIYSPEIFLEAPITPTLQIAGGYRHDSNGGGVTDSIDLNRLYLKLNKRIDLGHRWQVNLTPQIWYDVGDHGVAPDIDDFWGYAAVTASIEQRDGIKFSLFARGNPATGKGGSEFFLSYPLKSFGARNAGVYLFGQAFTGFGEQLIDYNREETRARIGISLTR